MENKSPLTHPALTPFDGSLFVWSEGVGTAYASELELTEGRPAPAFITIRSHRTGRVKVFSYVEGNGATAVYRSIDGVAAAIYNDIDELPATGW